MRGGGIQFCQTRKTFDVVQDEENATDHTLVHCKFIDWDKVRAIYDKDEIVRLEVNGFNRGGLLVEGEGIHGFVPVSHLTESEQYTGR